MGGYCVLNFKAYPNSFGARALELAKAAAEVADSSSVSIVVCPQAVDLRAIASQCKVPVFAQGVDANKPGAFTGSLTPEAVKDAGATGTLINHSERKLPLEAVNAIIDRCAEAGIFSLCCAATIDECAAIAAMRPDFIAIEPPELIGKGISVSTAKPEIVSGAVRAVKDVADIPVFCGAGVSNGVDVAKALELGAEGVLLASAFVNAKDPAALLREMADSL